MSEPSDAQLDGYVQEVHRHLGTMPDEVAELMSDMMERLCDLGEKHQIPPRQMGTGLASLVGTLALVDVRGNAENEDGINDFLDLITVALQAGATVARVKNGWKAPYLS